VHITLLTSGGYTGQRLTASLDTNELPQPQMAEAVRALEDLASAPPSVPSAGASQPRYRLTLTADTGERIVELTESQIPSTLRPLITELVNRARTGA
jgi:hypothetical protein